MSIQSAQSEKKTALENTVILIAMKPFTSTLVVCVALLTGCSMPSSSTAAKTRLVFPDGLVLTGTNRLVTPTRYQPPVEIRIVAKTDTTNLRIGYAADQKHKAGAGKIPANQFVDIRWVVSSKASSSSSMASSAIRTSSPMSS